MDIDAYFDAEMTDHAATAARTQAALREPFRRLADAALATLRQGNKILFFGNGGSAADAQHLATELVVRYAVNRKALPAIALTTDSSMLTAIGNDYSFDDLFARQIEGLGRPGDLAVAISTSGKSPNIVRALQTARAQGVIPAALSGRDGGDLVGLADPLVIVPSNTTARIQEMHIALGHMLCGVLERELGLV